MDTMGQTASHPLNLVLAHFEEVKARAHNLYIYEKKGKMTAYYSSEWPASNVR